MGGRTSKRYCNFCGKCEHEVQRLIAGPCAYICNECVQASVDILTGAGVTIDLTVPRPAPAQPITAGARNG